MFCADISLNEFESALVAASHGYILGVHMNECTLLNNVMKRNTSSIKLEYDSPT